MATSLLSARVKSVLSGDTVNLVSLRTTSDNDQERQLSLAYVSAPRLNSNEPFGFQAREFLRTLLVGKQVQFKVLYTVNGKEYGDVIAPVFPSLLEKVVGAGYAKIRDDASSKDHYEDFDLDSQQTHAQSEHLGLWNTENDSSNTVETLTSLDSSSENKALKAIVERVIAGDRLQMRIIFEEGSNQKHFLGQVLLGGVKCPRSSSPNEAGEPYGDQARSFVNARLLQRSVMSTIKGFAANGMPIVSIAHPAGDIAELLLCNGLGQVCDWHSAMLGPNKMKALRVAEASGKQQKCGMWITDDSHKSAASDSSNHFEGVVSKVISADTLAIRDNNDVEHTIQLASIRGPRKAESEAQYNAAKEFVRSHLIGKKAQVSVIYVRPKSDQFDERPIVVLEHNGKDVGLNIVEKGWAGVIKHKGTNILDRSPIWDDLVAAETDATTAQKGIHNKKKSSGTFKMVDASENAARARSFVSSFERQGSINGVVDYISNGGRYRLIVPRENCTLSFVLAGIRVPKPKESHGDKALDFAVRRLWQRDVKLAVQGVDKTGAFIGNLFLPSAGAEVPFSIALVKEGLAEVHDYSAESSGFYNELLDAEKIAKSRKLGVWENYVEEDEQDEDEAQVNVVTQQLANQNGLGTSSWASATTSTPVRAPVAPSAVKYIDVKVTEVDTDGSIYLRESSREAAFAKLEADLASYNNSAVNSASFPLKKHPKVGEIVAVQVDSKWRRARISQFTKPDTYDLTLVDSGTKKRINSSSSLRALAPQFSVSVSPAFAKEAALSYVEKPPHDYMADYVDYLREQVVGKSVACCIDGQKVASGPSNVTLYTAESKGRDDSVNKALVYEGYAFVDERPVSWQDKAMLSALKDAQAAAKSDRIGVWEYGDPRDEL